MFGDNIRRFREARGLGVNELSRLSGVNASYISALERGEKENPTIQTLEKIADTLGVTLDQIMKSTPVTKDTIKKWDNDLIREDSSLYGLGEFKDLPKAMEYLVKNNASAAFGGYSLKDMSEEEIIEFANELARQFKLLSYKYKK